MKNGYTNITGDLKNLLDGYMNKTSAEEFLKVLEAENFSSVNEELKISEPDKSQVEFELPKGIDYRLLVDRIITHCEEQLSEDRYYNLLLDLSQLILFAGENAYSLEIVQYLKSKVEPGNKFSSILADANLIISKIYWSQAYWDECEFHISEATKIFESISSQSGIAKCENMLGTLYGEKGASSDSSE